MGPSYLHREDTPAETGVQALGVFDHVLLLSDFLFCLLQAFFRIRNLFGARGRQNIAFEVLHAWWGYTLYCHPWLPTERGSDPPFPLFCPDVHNQEVGVSSRPFPAWHTYDVSGN